MVEARLIVDAAQSGSRNMAVDQALLQSVSAGGPPVLRFYRWLPATLSLGYFQTADSRNSHRASLSCDVVRRVTGGGAILHDRELTYSLTIPYHTRRSSEHQRLYAIVHRAIIETLRQWRIQAELFHLPEPASDRAHFLCFQRRSPGDIVCGPSKIVGSAQRRGENALLQHGSVILDRSPFAPEIDGIQQVAGVTVAADELIGGVTSHLGSALGWSFYSSNLHKTEESKTQEIQQKQFDRVDWTYRR